ncbi:hypothetical protein ACFY4C_09495 [Actinomadura viridis]|uniref:LppU/SCO3897 family protein n=1 Tax=Actinomadura viridis TaxID=58110 RepID=UPI0036A6D365
MPGQPGQPAGKSGGSLWGGLAVLLVVALLVGGGGYWIWSQGRDHIDKVAAGDCLRESAGDQESPYRIVACDDPAAAYKALKLLPLSKGCRDVAGVSRQVGNDANTVCLGEKDADPAKAVNVAKVGDCLSLGGSQAQRVDCSSPQARYKVLLRRTNVLEMNARRTCSSVPGAVSSYTWNMQSTGKFGNLSRMNVDVLLCLGRK